MEQRMRKIKSREELIVTMKERRLELGLTQRQLANKCAISQKTISRIENGKDSSSINNFMAIMAALEVTFLLKVKT